MNMNPKNSKELAASMKACGDGTFSKIGNAIFGFKIRKGKCEIFDTAEIDDFRHEEFESAEKALDGFVIDGKPIASYAGQITISPCLTV